MASGNTLCLYSKSRPTVDKRTSTVPPSKLRTMAKKKSKKNNAKKTEHNPMTMAEQAEVRDWLDDMNRQLKKSH